MSYAFFDLFLAAVQNKLAHLAGGNIALRVVCAVLLEAGQQVLLTKRRSDAVPSVHDLPCIHVEAVDFVLFHNSNECVAELFLSRASLLQLSVEHAYFLVSLHPAFDVLHQVLLRCHVYVHGNDVLTGSGTTSIVSHSIMHPSLDFILRSAPAWTTLIAVLIASFLGYVDRPSEGAIALAAGASGALGDVAAHLLKIFLTEPLYRALNKDTLPLLGRGPRPDGAERCGWWPMANKARAKQTYGLPSGHAAHSIAMLVFLIAIRPRRPSAVYIAAVACMGIIALAVSASRVSLGCHTPGQVAWGCVLGYGVGLGCARLMPRSLVPEHLHGGEKAE